MTIYLVLLIGLMIAQAVAIFYLWQRLLRIESERAVEAVSHEQLQKQLAAAQRNIQDIALLAQQKVVEHEPRQQLPTASSEGISPYNQAVEMFKRGLGSADVAERCGISRSEAELILSLYRNSPTS
ncbi:DUF2802 domain-containing protein [Vogesella indigofera]|uniref:DUF2802 domain-containing protein n=1 Tax=Vogesella indigofera TaxID=45465 RepID=UPI00234E41E0|nr:DUF2802 domain-containing protein [Vogesella indigofera]MDC7711170.1 DUF2802 domain-containing protein [Vogesella indigofera]